MNLAICISHATQERENSVPDRLIELEPCPPCHWQTGWRVFRNSRPAVTPASLANASTKVLNEKHRFVQHAIDLERDERCIGQDDSPSAAGGPHPGNLHSRLRFADSSSAFCRARRAVAQPSLVTCRDRPTASAPGGTSRVMQEPAPTYAPSPMTTGATRVESLPTKAPSPICVRFLWTPS